MSPCLGPPKRPEYLSCYMNVTMSKQHRAAELKQYQGVNWSLHSFWPKGPFFVETVKRQKWKWAMGKVWIVQLLFYLWWLLLKAGCGFFSISIVICYLSIAILLPDSYWPVTITFCIPWSTFPNYSSLPRWLFGCRHLYLAVRWTILLSRAGSRLKPFLMSGN